MYDPLEFSRKIETQVLTADILKKYYRFRGAKYYGGISTADAVGCNLYCQFCWVHPKIRYQIQNVGTFHSPEKAAQQLVEIAQKAHFRQLRISGGEPTIGQAHLIALLEYLADFPYSFILETNGMLLSDETYVKELQKFNHLYVRVSLKAGTPEMFSRVTGANPDAFHYPLDALKLLSRYEIPCHASIIIDFCSHSDLQSLKQMLLQINPKLVSHLEYETLLLYPHVKKGLKKIGLL